MTIQQASGRSLRASARAVRRQAGRVAGGDTLAIGLGLFSVGLGLAELATTRQLARGIGMPEDDDHLAVLRGAGLRELATGVGILTNERPKALLWSRVAGDVMDLLLLGRAAQSESADRTRLAAAGAAVLGVTVLDAIAAARAADGELSMEGTRSLREQLPRLRAEAVRRLPSLSRDVSVSTSITINKPRAQVFAFWRDLRNLPTFMSHLEEVQAIGAGKTRWTAKAPLGRTVQWDAEVTDERDGALIAWRSLPGADVANQGRVRFVDAPGQRGTEIHVELSYQPPGGVVGATFAKLFGEEPSEQVRSDLRRFKQVMETGEVLHSDASIHSGAHPAQPSNEPLQRAGALLSTRQGARP